MESKVGLRPEGRGSKRPAGWDASAGVPRRLRRSFQRAVQQGHRLRELARGPGERLGLVRPKVSRWSVAQHLEHLARSNQLMLDIIDEILEEEGAAVSVRPSLIGWLVLFTGWIPRGRGKAPEAAVPRSLPETELLGLIIDGGRRVDRLGGRLKEIDRASGRRRHFAFGGLTASQWLRVIEVHNRHHLRIVDDILSGHGSEPARPT